MIRSIAIFVAGVLIFAFAVQRLIALRNGRVVAQQPPPAAAHPSPQRTVAPRPIDRVVRLTVSELNYVFLPGDLTVPAGTRVTWTNETASPHTITSVTPHLFDRQLPGRGRTAIRFARPGIYSYYCALHPYMLGVITVQ